MGGAGADVREAPAASQRVEERGGARDAVSGLQLLVRQGRRGQVASRSQRPWRDQAAGAADNGTERRAEPENGGRGTEGGTRGWKQYFRLAATPRVFAEQDKWLRHRLRALQLKQWKQRSQGLRELRAREPSTAAARVAANPRRWWPTPDAGATRTHSPLLRPHRSAPTCRITSTIRTAGCGPACPVVWQGSSGAPLPPMPIDNRQNASRMLLILQDLVGDLLQGCRGVAQQQFVALDAFEI